MGSARVAFCGEMQAQPGVVPVDLGSLLETRSAVHRIRRQLREQPGPVTDLRCPFHGYAWNLDGSLKHVPCQWDFPQVVPEEFRAEAVAEAMHATLKLA